MAKRVAKTVEKTAPVVEPIKEESVVEKEEPVKPSTKESKEIRVKNVVDPNQIVTVRNGFNGTLVYVSKRTGEQWIWENFGDEQDLDVSELRNARNSAKAFFQKGWFLIDDPDVVEYLGVQRFYDTALTMEEYESLGKMTAKEITERLSALTAEQKQTVAARVRTMIRDGQIDSIKAITALEDCLGVKLIER